MTASILLDILYRYIVNNDNVSVSILKFIDPKYIKHYDTLFRGIGTDDEDYFVPGTFLGEHVSFTTEKNVAISFANRGAMKNNTYSTVISIHDCFAIDLLSLLLDISAEVESEDADLMIEIVKEEKEVLLAEACSIFAKEVKVDRNEKYIDIEGVIIR